MPTKITGPHGPSLPIQSSADFNKSWTCRYFTARTMPMPAATYRTHFHLELTVEETFRDCSTAPVSGWVCMEWESLPFSCINVERELHRGIVNPGQCHDFMLQRKLIKNGITPLPFPLPALLKQYGYINAGRGSEMRGHAPFYATLGFRKHASVIGF